MANIAVHTISFRGLAGAIFICLLASCVMYVIGFATPGWRVSGSYHEGLWQACNTFDSDRKPDWFRATQAMICIGLILLILAVVLISVYMCVHSISKNTVIMALIIVCFSGVVFMTIGFIIYGVKTKDQSWSYAMSVIGAIFALIAGVLSVVQMRQSGVQI